jgi:Flp pilus assembly pilin Flp
MQRTNAHERADARHRHADEHRASGARREGHIVQAQIERWRQVASQLRQKGQGLAEYGLLLVLIAVACVATVTALGTSVVSLYSKASFAF